MKNSRKIIKSSRNSKVPKIKENSKNNKYKNYYF